MMIIFFVVMLAIVGSLCFLAWFRYSTAHFHGRRTPNPNDSQWS